MERNTRKLAIHFKIIRAFRTCITPGKLGEDWVGLVIQEATEEDYKNRPPITESFIDLHASSRYRMVPKEAIVNALEKAGKTEAATLLRNFPSGKYIPLEKNNCKDITD